MAQLATSILIKMGWGWSHSCSFDHPLRPRDASDGDSHSLSMGRGHGDLSFLLLLGVMPRCPTSAKLFSAVDRSQGLGRSRFVLESRITFQVTA
jgi:hypothetical protein